MYPYSNNIRAASVSDNIRIRIHIRLENMKMEVARALSDPFPPLHWANFYVRITQTDKMDRPIGVALIDHKQLT